MSDYPCKCVSCGTEEPKRFEDELDDLCVPCGEERLEIERAEAASDEGIDLGGES